MKYNNSKKLVDGIAYLLKSYVFNSAHLLALTVFKHTAKT